MATSSRWQRLAGKAAPERRPPFSVPRCVKNSLQIVSSLLYLQAKTAGPAADQFNSAAARVAAITAVHQQLCKYDDVGTVALDRFIVDLCQRITTASDDPDRAIRLSLMLIRSRSQLTWQCRLHSW